MTATTWDPLNKTSNEVLSSGNLVAAAGGLGTVAATRILTGSKSYFEVGVALGSLYPVFSTTATSGDATTIKSQTSDFLFTVPSGFSAWDSSAGTFASAGGGVVLSNSNKTATGGGSIGGSAIGATGHNTGKWYLEFNVDGITGGSWPVWECGLGTAAYLASTTDLTHNGTLSAGFQSDGIMAYNSASLGVTLGAPATNDRYCIAIDIGANLFWMRKNGGNWNNSGTANPATGTGGLTVAGLAVTAPTYAVGMTNRGYNMASGTILGTDANGIGFKSTGAVVINNSTISTIFTYAAGDTIGIAIDLPRRLLWATKNGTTWNNDIIANQNPVGDVGGISFSTMTLGAVLPSVGSSGAGSIYTGAFTSFTYTPPTGYITVDTVQSVSGPVNLRGRSPITRSASPPNSRTSFGVPYNGSRQWMGTTRTTVEGIITKNGVAQPFAKIRAFDHNTGFYLGAATSDKNGLYAIPCLGRGLVDVVAYLYPSYNELVAATVIPLP